MKRLLLFAAAALLSVSCLDKDFDLSEIVTDDIQIGSEDTVLRLPLATITVKGSAIDADNGTYASLTEIFGEADKWTPLSYESVSLTRLNESGYFNKLVDDLIAELAADNSRRDMIATLIAGQYSSSVAVPAELSAKGVNLHDYIYDYLSAPLYKDRIKGSIHQLAGAHLESLTSCIEPISQKIKGFEIDDDVIDALIGDGKEIRVYGTVANGIPIDCTGSFALMPRHSGEDQAAAAPGQAERLIGIDLDLNYGRTEPVEAKLDDNQKLHGMTDDMNMTVEFTPTTYYPRRELPGDSENALTMELKLEKKGGLNIGSIID